MDRFSTVEIDGTTYKIDYCFRGYQLAKEWFGITLDFKTLQALLTGRGDILDLVNFMVIGLCRHQSKEELDAFIDTFDPLLAPEEVGAAFFAKYQAAQPAPKKGRAK